MKKMLFIFVLFLLINVQEVVASSPVIYDGVEVHLQDSCNYVNFDNWQIDIMIDKTDYPEDAFNDEVNAEYKEKFPNYETYEYLNDDSTNWVSYTAFYKGAERESSLFFCSVIFASTDIYELESFLFVSFNNAGGLRFISDEISASDMDNVGSKQGFIRFNFLYKNYALNIVPVPVDPAEVMFKELLFFTLVPLIMFAFVGPKFTINRNSAVKVSLITRVLSYIVYMYFEYFDLWDSPNWVFLFLYVIVSLSEIALFAFISPDEDHKGIYKLVSITYGAVVIGYILVFIIFRSITYY